MFFGMRSRTAHINLKWGDVELKETSTGAKFPDLSEKQQKLEQELLVTPEHLPLKGTKHF